MFVFTQYPWSQSLPRVVFEECTCEDLLILCFQRSKRFKQEITGLFPLFLASLPLGALSMHYSCHLIT